MWPDWTVCEAVDSLNLADLSVPEPFNGFPCAGAGGSLVTHLGSHAVFRGEFGQKPCLIDCEGERLLYIDVLSGGHGLGRDDGVCVVGCSDHHGVSLVQHLVVHHAVVIVLLGLWVLIEHMVGVLPVHIAESDDVFGLHFREVGRSTASDADTKDVQFVVGRDFLFLFFLRCLLTCDDDVRGYSQSCSHCCSCLQEGAS